MGKASFFHCGFLVGVLLCMCLVAHAAEEEGNKANAGGRRLLTLLRSNTVDLNGPSTQQPERETIDVTAREGDPIGRRTINQAFKKMAVVVLGGEQRWDHMKAAYRGWTAHFQKRLFVTDSDWVPEDADPGLVDRVVNVYKGLDTEEERLKEHLLPEHFYWQNTPVVERARVTDPQLFKAGWLLAQPRYLLATELLRETYPRASWYIVVDCDTLVYPLRLIAGILRYQNPADPMGFGHMINLYSKDRTNLIGAENGALLPRAFPMALGGAGVVFSSSVFDKVNISACVEKQKNYIGWNIAPSDWRVSLCLFENQVMWAHVAAMYQTNENLTCSGNPLVGCLPVATYTNLSSPCPYTLHYQGPQNLDLYNHEPEQICRPYYGIEGYAPCLCHKVVDGGR